MQKKKKQKKVHENVSRNTNQERAVHRHEVSRSKVWSNYRISRGFFFFIFVLIIIKLIIIQRKWTFKIFLNFIAANLIFFWYFNNKKKKDSTYCWERIVRAVSRFSCSSITKEGNFDEHNNSDSLNFKNIRPRCFVDFCVLSKFLINVHCFFFFFFGLGSKLQVFFFVCVCVCVCLLSRISLSLSLTAGALTCLRLTFYIIIYMYCIYSHVYWLFND